jgi:hypothetical protein
MRHLAQLALACLVLTGSIASADSPFRQRPSKVKKHKLKKHRVKVAPPPVVEDDEAEDDEAETTARKSRLDKRTEQRRERIARERDEADDDDGDDAPKARVEKPKRAPIERNAETDEETAADERVGAREDDADVIDEVEMAPMKLSRTSAAKTREWNFAIGPYLWASAVEADVSLGSESVGAGIGFMDITRHARYGVPIQAEARYGRFSVAADFMYGVVDLAGDKDVGPVMVSVSGTASSLLFDADAGVLLYGGDHSVLSVEARAGLRYQRTAINGQVGIDNSPVASPTKVTSSSDGIGGARIALRPFKKLAITGAFDTLMFGDSSKSWSGSGDASYQFGKRVLVSLGWRTLTTASANLTLTMYGPRAAVHFLF